MSKCLAVATLLCLGVTAAHADGNARAYTVEITNITAGQVFSPLVAATHRSSIAFFEAGAPASEGIIEVAENGDGGPLIEALSGASEVFDVVGGSGPIPPGQSQSFEIESVWGFSRLSLATMLVNTNDAFAGLDRVRLPRYRGSSTTVFATAYDSGSEANNEQCEFIPGPACPADSGNDPAPEGSEGFVHVHRGVHGVRGGDLVPEKYDWRNPVAKISIRRIR